MDTPFARWTSLSHCHYVHYFCSIEWGNRCNRVSGWIANNPNNVALWLQQGHDLGHDLCRWLTWHHYSAICCGCSDGPLSNCLGGRSAVWHGIPRADYGFLIFNLHLHSVCGKARNGPTNSAGARGSEFHGKAVDFN